MIIILNNSTMQTSSNILSAELALCSSVSEDLSSLTVVVSSSDTIDEQWWYIGIGHQYS